MFRSWLLPVLCAASFSAAIPLHNGESWVWQVSNRDNLDVTYRTAQILSSKPCAYGKIWMIAVRDSLNQQSDTAQILSWKNGKQSWLAKSYLMDLELGPRKDSADSVVEIDNLCTYRWGQPSGTTSNDVTTKIDSIVTINRLGHVETSFPLFLGAWSDSVGIERALVFQNSFRGWNWELIRHNQKPIPLSRPAHSIPTIGSEMEWEYVQDSILVDRVGFNENQRTIIQGGRISCRILGVIPDSGDWISISIREQFRQRIYKFKESKLDPSLRLYPPSADDTVRIPLSDSISNFDLQINLSTGQVGANQSLIPFWEGWMKLWSDAKRTDSVFVRDFQSAQTYSPFLLEFPRTSSSLHLKMAAHQLDSFYFNSHFTQTGRAPSALLTPNTTIISSTNARLLRIDSQWIRSPVHVGIHKDSRHILGSFQSLLQDHPQARVRWATASGRTGTLTAKELARSPIQLRGQTLVLQAILPDGRTWQGTQVLP